MTIWRGECLKCNSYFEHPEKTKENPSPAGTICPVCHDAHKVLVGVVHWEPYLPELTASNLSTIMRGITLDDLKFIADIVELDGDRVVTDEEVRRLLVTAAYARSNVSIMSDEKQRAIELINELGLK